MCPAGETKASDFFAAKCQERSSIKMTREKIREADNEIEDSFGEI